MSKIPGGLSVRVLFVLLLAHSACDKGPPPELVRLEIPAMVTSTDPARALVRARYPTRGSVLSPGPHEFEVMPPDVASATPDGSITCQKSGDAKIVVSVLGVKDDETLRCRIVARIEVSDLPPLDVAKGPVTVPARAVGKDGKELSDVPVVLTSERPSIVRVTGNALTPVAVGETGVVARAGNAEKRLRARSVRTLEKEALPMDGGRRINMSLTEGKYELNLTLRSERTVSVEWRGAPYCAYRATAKTHRSNCVLQGKGGVVFDNPAFLEGGSTDVSTNGVVLAEVP